MGLELRFSLLWPPSTMFVESIDLTEDGDEDGDEDGLEGEQQQVSEVSVLA